MKLYLLLTIVACLLMMTTICACQTKGDFKSLIKDVESYHRDLIFERYEIAAKNITPKQRGAWLDAIQSQNLHFAEIEIMSTSPCDITEAVDKDEKDKCAVIESYMQWFVKGSPSVQEGRVRTTWQYDEEEKVWFIVEQEQH